MADLTPSLNDLLRAHNTHRTRRKGHRPHLNDEFLKEAYSINSHITSFTTYIHSIRQAYLRIDPAPHHRLQQHHNSHKRSPSTPTYFTTPQRDQLDAESKSLLRSLHASIRQLEEAETLRQETALKLHQHKYSHRYGFGAALSRWAAGDENSHGKGKGSPEEEWEKAERETLKTWRESVIWYLKKKLEEAGEAQRSMMERRLQREVERSKSNLYKSRGVRGSDYDSSSFPGEKGTTMNGHAGPGGAVMQEEEENQKRKQAEEGLTAEQVQ
ncbi:MAG: hypothetical protein Q9174_005986, partial [Haloplaca sp. 1 TL-2023]